MFSTQLKRISAAFAAAMLLSPAAPALADPTDSSASPSPNANTANTASREPLGNGLPSLILDRKEAERQEAITRAQDLKAKADALADEFAKASVEWENGQIKLTETEKAIVTLDKEIERTRRAADKARTLINQAAGQAWMDGENSELLLAAAVLNGDPSELISRSQFVVSAADWNDKQRQEALMAWNENKSARAKRELLRRSLTAKQAELDTKKKSLEAQLEAIAELQQQADSAIPEAVDRSVLGQGNALNLSGLNEWEAYTKELADNGIVPPPAAVLNDPSKWDKSWLPVPGVSGQWQEGVAQVISGTTKKPVLILSQEAMGAIEVGFSAIGTPYSWGGGTPSSPSYGFAQGAGIYGYDCSGLMVRIFGAQGYNIQSIARVADRQQSVYKKVPNTDILPGDMVFFGSPAYHVGLYLGNGKMLEAPRTGDFVKVSPLRNYVNATRISLSDTKTREALPLAFQSDLTSGVGAITKNQSAAVKKAAQSGVVDGNRGN